MDVRISARHLELDPDMKEYASTKLEGLKRHYSGLRSVELVLDEDQLKSFAEIIAHVARGAPVVASARHEKQRGAIDLAYGKLDGLLRRLKEKTEDRRHGRHAVIPEAVTPDLGEETADTGTFDVGDVLEL